MGPDSGISDPVYQRRAIARAVPTSHNYTKQTVSINFINLLFASWGLGMEITLGAGMMLGLIRGDNAWSYRCGKKKARTGVWGSGGGDRWVDG